MQGQFVRRAWAACLAATLVLVGAPLAARAGCGCEKAPPAPAQLRPAATYAGSDVAIFHPALAPGQAYAVEFASGTTSAAQSANGVAALRRDLSDGATRPQVVVPLPDLPLGPVSVTLRHVASGTALMTLSDDQLTVVPQPIVVPEGVSSLDIPDYRAAVGRDGLVYLALDLSELRAARVFRTQLEGVPLRFDAEDVLFYNVQGFLMQVLDGSIPGLSSISEADGDDSDWLAYSRHEFDTFFLAHEERASHAIDSSDPNWHLDGTPHIDHDHQIVQIAASHDGGTLSPGATEAGDLVLETHTLFDHGLFGSHSVSLSNEGRVDGYTTAGSYGSGGDVASNGKIRVKNEARVDGDARGAKVRISSGGRVTGEVVQGAAPIALLPVDVPSGLTWLGSLDVTNEQQHTLEVGSYRLSELRVDNAATLRIRNADGPVTLYVEGDVKVTNEGRVLVDDPDPEKFAIYVKGFHDVDLDNEGEFYGVVYAPDAKLTFTNEGEYHGAFVGRKVKIDNGARVHFDRGLRGE